MIIAEKEDLCIVYNFFMQSRISIIELDYGIGIIIHSVISVVIIDRLEIPIMPLTVIKEKKGFTVVVGVMPLIGKDTKGLVFERVKKVVEGVHFKEKGKNYYSPMPLVCVIEIKKRVLEEGIYEDKIVFHIVEIH